MRTDSVVWLIAAFLACAAADLASSSCSSGPVIDLGYAKYQGCYNSSYSLNIWKSIRYAAPPIGKLRWQAPQDPRATGSSDRIVPAVHQPPSCPQSGAYGTPKVYGFNSGPGNEDCLYLNVFAASNATKLPVLVWIHGGGYSVFGATYDPSEWMKAYRNGFVTVEIQYRLGAFGYLASAQVKKKGQLNAGLLDQHFALKWVQKHIAKFGGDPTRVTVGGESSGAGSAMYLAMAHGGRDSHIFNNVLAASPYTPPIYTYSDDVPTANHDKFAELAGCGERSAGVRQHSTVFDCLVAADTAVLQNASGTVSTTRGYFGSFAFIPVVDGVVIRQRPSEQLLLGRVSGKRLLVGNNANEGVPLTNPRVKTQAQYDSFMASTFPLLTRSDIALLKQVYRIENATLGNDGVRFDTLGDRGPTALARSEMATGIQQAVFNMVAETTFNCPAQWLAEAFSSHPRKAWKYQYSVTPSYHGADLSAYFPAGAGKANADFNHAFQKIWGNFIINNDPIISVADATANAANATVPMNGKGDGKLRWPAYSLVAPWQMDLNTTGGRVALVTATEDLSYFVREGKGIVNKFRLSDALAWEGGRGARCDFWRTISARIPQ